MSKIIIGSPDPSFNPIELKIKKECFKAYFRKKYYDINDEDLSEKLYYYALDVIEGRWPEAEPTIMQNPRYAYRYARDIVKERWKEAEPHIMKDPQCAYYYARDVIKERWPKAEPHIKKDKLYLSLYEDYIKCEL